MRFMFAGWQWRCHQCRRWIDRLGFDLDDCGRFFMVAGRRVRAVDFFQGDFDLNHESGILFRRFLLRFE